MMAAGIWKNAAQIFEYVGHNLTPFTSTRPKYTNLIMYLPGASAGVTVSKLD